MGEYIDQSPSYPKSIVTSTLLNFDRAFDQIGEAYTQGKLNGQIVQLHIAGGDLDLERPFKHVSPDVKKRVMKLFEDIGAGKVNVSE